MPVAELLGAFCVGGIGRAFGVAVEASWRRRCCHARQTRTEHSSQSSMLCCSPLLNSSSPRPATMSSPAPRVPPPGDHSHKQVKSHSSPLPRHPVQFSLVIALLILYALLILHTHHTCPQQTLTSPHQPPSQPRPRQNLLPPPPLPRPPHSLPLLHHRPRIQFPPHLIRQRQHARTHRCAIAAVFPTRHSLARLTFSAGG